MWDLAHQRCNYLICKCNGFGYIKNCCALCYKQMTQTAVTDLCFERTPWVPSQWTVHLYVLCCPNYMACVLLKLSKGTVTHIYTESNIASKYHLQVWTTKDYSVKYNQSMGKHFVETMRHFFVSVHVQVILHLSASSFNFCSQRYPLLAFCNYVM